MYSNLGEVVNVNTTRQRQAEIGKWSGHSWFTALWALNAELSDIDPNYTLIQVKMKFSRLCYYIHSDAPPRRRAQMNECIRNTERAIEKYELMKREFERNAIPPDHSFQQVEW